MATPSVRIAALVLALSAPAAWAGPSPRIQRVRSLSQSYSQFGGAAAAPRSFAQVDGGARGLYGDIANLRGDGARGFHDDRRGLNRRLAALAPEISAQVVEATALNLLQGVMERERRGEDATAFLNSDGRLTLVLDNVRRLEATAEGRQLAAAVRTMQALRAGARALSEVRDDAGALPAEGGGAPVAAAKPAVHPAARLAPAPKGARAGARRADSIPNLTASPAPAESGARGRTNRLGSSGMVRLAAGALGVLWLVVALAAAFPALPFAGPLLALFPGWVAANPAMIASAAALLLAGALMSPRPARVQDETTAPARQEAPLSARDHDAFYDGVIAPGVAAMKDPSAWTREAYMASHEQVLAMYDRVAADLGETFDEYAASVHDLGYVGDGNWGLEERARRSDTPFVGGALTPAQEMMLTDAGVAKYRGRLTRIGSVKLTLADVRPDSRDDFFKAVKGKKVNVAGVAEDAVVYNSLARPYAALVKEAASHADPAGQLEHLRDLQRIYVVSAFMLLRMGRPLDAERMSEAMHFIWAHVVDRGSPDPWEARDLVRKPLSDIPPETMSFNESGWRAVFSQIMLNYARTGDHDVWFDKVVVNGIEASRTASTWTKPAWIMYYNPMVSFVKEIERSLSPEEIEAYAPAVHDNGYFPNQRANIENPKSAFVGSALSPEQEDMLLPDRPNVRKYFARRFHTHRDARGRGEKFEPADFRGVKLQLADIKPERRADFLRASGKRLDDAEAAALSLNGKGEDISEKVEVFNTFAASWEDLVADAGLWADREGQMAFLRGKQISAVATALALVRLGRGLPREMERDATAFLWKFVGHWDGKDGWDMKALVRTALNDLTQAEKDKDLPVHDAAVEAAARNSLGSRLEAAGVAILGRGTRHGARVTVAQYGDVTSLPVAVDGIVIPQYPAYASDSGVAATLNRRDNRVSQAAYIQRLQESGGRLQFGTAVPVRSVVDGKPMTVLNVVTAPLEGDASYDGVGERRRNIARALYEAIKALPAGQRRVATPILGMAGAGRGRMDGEAFFSALDMALRMLRQDGVRGVEVVVVAREQERGEAGQGPSVAAALARAP